MIERLKSRSVGDISYVLVVMVLISVGVLRIVSTYDVFWHTWDEPFHIAAGMEWLAQGQYTYEHFHPPLARVLAALGPYLSGLGDMGTVPGNPWIKGNAILLAGGAYEHNLALARIGILPLFVVASVVVALWAKRVVGRGASLIALVLFTSLPPILAHSGVATLDMACAALVLAALFVFVVWLNKPTNWYSVGLGVTVGLALLSKMTALGFLALSAVLIAAAYMLYSFTAKTEGSRSSNTNLKDWLRASAIVFVLCSLTIWAGYRFSVASLAATVDDEIRAHAYGLIASRLGSSGSLYDTALMFLNTAVPAPEFFVGVFRALHRASNGHPQLLFGEIRFYGWWYYYPVVLMIKTPLPTLILSMVGLLFVFRSTVLRNENWFERSAPVLVLISVMVFGMLTSVNDGIRAVLAVYGALALIAGYGAAELISLPNKYLRIFGIFSVAVLILWQSISSFRTHPDYLAYFNQLAGDEPERIVVGSDLDWAQDVKRLSIALHDYEIDTIKMNLPGIWDIEKFDFPPSESLKPYKRETGWIAISTSRLTFGTREPPHDQYSWLEEHEPVAKIGTTIKLYYIEENQSGQ